MRAADPAAPVDVPAREAEPVGAFFLCFFGAADPEHCRRVAESLGRRWRRSRPSQSSTGAVVRVLNVKSNGNVPADPSALFSPPAEVAADLGREGDADVVLAPETDRAEAAPRAW